jgi:multidrug efflux pump
LFWPGVVGQFMKYLPITLIATLSASLAVALFFTPTLGALLGKASRADEPGSGRVSGARTVKLPRWPLAWLASAAANPHDERAKDRGPYMRTVRLALRRPGLTLALAALLLVVVRAAISRSTRRIASSARSRSACSPSTASRPSIPASASSRAA